MPNLVTNQAETRPDIEPIRMKASSHNGKQSLVHTAANVSLLLALYVAVTFTPYRQHRVAEADCAKEACWVSAGLV